VFEEVRKPSDTGVFDFASRFAEDKQPGAGALRLRGLRDQLGRQIEAEI